MACPEKQKNADFRIDYASRADFCEEFERELKPLYLLAFLLTANHEKAERCFAMTVEEALNKQSVFKEWVRPWIKRILIKNAIGVVFSTPTRISDKRDLWSEQHDQHGMGRDDEINSVTELPRLERFVYVMSILERYSAWECSVLLDCSTKTLAESRLQALRRLPPPVGLFPRIEPHIDAQQSGLVESVA
jgi:DNA-directed RNA polymerase specialized sigma24 family protein